MKTSSAEKPKKQKTYLPAFDTIPDEGAPAPIGKGIYWLRFPLHFELNHINLWLLESASGWTIVDTGFNDAASVAHWEKLFFTARFDRKPVESIVVTHFHPDHFGLAGWLAEKTGVAVNITKGEHDAILRLTGSADDLASTYRAYYAEAGVAAEVTETLIARRFNYRKSVSAPPKNVAHIRIGEELTLGGRAWKILGGYGHSPEHACLYCAEEKVFIAGDIVLPDISPNISFFPGGSPDPVDDYLRCLDNIQATVPDDVIVLPSHGVPFKGLHRRIEELKAHHQRRFAQMNEVMASGPMSAYQIMLKLFAHRKLEGSDVFFALGETLAHIVHEEKRGRVVKGPGGAYRLSG